MAWPYSISANPRFLTHLRKSVTLLGSTWSTKKGFSSRSMWMPSLSTGNLQGSKLSTSWGTLGNGTGSWDSWSAMLTLMAWHSSKNEAIHSSVPARFQICKPNWKSELKNIKTSLSIHSFAAGNQFSSCFLYYYMFRKILLHYINVCQIQQKLGIFS